MSTVNVKLCSIDGCTNEHLARGWCRAHYSRWYKHGDPLAVRPRGRRKLSAEEQQRSTEERFLSCLEPQGECLIWTGRVDGWGYGQIRSGSSSLRAHRYAWERVNGPIPSGAEIDHGCRNRACCNIAHLRIATRKQNAENTGLRADNTSGYRGVHWHCGKWRAVVKHNGRKYLAGRFDDVHEAGAAAKALRLRLFTYNDIDRKGGSS